MEKNVFDMNKKKKKKDKEMKVQDTNFLSSKKCNVISLNPLLSVIHDKRKNSSEKVLAWMEVSLLSALMIIL